jgi:hypothetical protein
MAISVCLDSCPSELHTNPTAEDDRCKIPYGSGSAVPEMHRSTRVNSVANWYVSIVESGGHQPHDSLVAALLRESAYRHHR